MQEPSPERPPAEDWKIVLAVLAVALAVIVFRASDTWADRDLWGHVRFGLDHLDSGELAVTDPYSYLSHGPTWINHEWVEELLCGLAFRAGGGTGLIVLKISVLLLSALALIATLRAAGLAAVPTAILFLATEFLMLGGWGTVRPQMFTYLLFQLTVWAIVQMESGARWALALIPVIFALWANLHGGFLAGLAIVTLWALAQVALAALPPAWRAGATPQPLWAIMAAATAWLASLANPYGYRLHVFLFQTATIPRPEITEWGGINLTTPEGIGYVVFALATCAAVVSSGLGWFRPRLVLLAACLVLPLMAMRHLPLCACGATVLTAADWSAAWRRWFGPSRKTSQDNNQASSQQPALLEHVLAVVFAGAAVLIFSLSVLRWQCLVANVNDAYRVPHRAVSLLSRIGAEGKMVVHFDWGEYVLWHLGPRVKVSVDGRRETVYDPTIYRENLDFTYGLENWERLLERDPPDFILIMRSQPTYALLAAQPQWRLAYEDQYAALFLPQGSAWAARLAAQSQDDLPAADQPLCFP